MNRDEFAYYLRLSLCPGIGPVNFRKLLEAEDFDISRLFHSSSKQLSARGLNEKQISYPYWFLLWFVLGGSFLIYLKRRLLPPGVVVLFQL